MSEQGSDTPSDRVETTAGEKVSGDTQPLDTERGDTERGDTQSGEATSAEGVSAEEISGGTESADVTSDESTAAEAAAVNVTESLDENSGIEHSAEAIALGKEPPPTGTPIKRVPQRAWLVIGLLAVAGAFAAGLWQTSDNDTLHAEGNGEPQIVFLASTPTVVPTLDIPRAEVLLPTPTTTPDESQSVAESEPAAATTESGALLIPEDMAQELPEDLTEGMTEVIASDLPTFALALPTVTPTPEPPPVAPRAVQIGGQGNLRMQMGNPDFQSSGHPIQRPIEPRTYVLDGDTPIIEDQWCMQMGLVNLDLNISFELNPTTSAVNAIGTADLYNDFCENRGSLTDSTTISLTIPADARSQSAYNLFAERQLLNLAGLLDMDSGVILELNISNARPATE